MDNPTPRLNGRIVGINEPWPFRCLRCGASLADEPAFGCAQCIGNIWDEPSPCLDRIEQQKREARG